MFPLVKFYPGETPRDKSWRYGSGNRGNSWVRRNASLVYFNRRSLEGPVANFENGRGIGWVRLDFRDLIRGQPGLETNPVRPLVHRHRQLERARTVARIRSKSSHRRGEGLTRRVDTDQEGKEHRRHTSLVAFSTHSRLITKLRRSALSRSSRNCCSGLCSPIDTRDRLPPASPLWPR